MKKYKSEKFYYDNSAILGYKAIFYILLGGRGCGKTFSTQKYCIKRWLKTGEPFAWLRLKEPSMKKLLANNAQSLIDSELVRKYNLNFVVRGNSVYVQTGPGKNDLKEFCRVMALSTFYQDKGISMNRKSDGTPKSDRLKKCDENMKNEMKPYKTIVLDEMNSERSEKKTFDICYALVNQLENLCRLDTSRRVFLLGNTLEEGSDILAGAFNFIPDEFGIYKLHKKSAVIHYIEDSDKYKAARKNSIAGILAPDESTFTNKVKSDLELIAKVNPSKLKPSGIVLFDNNKKYVLCGNIITQRKVPEGAKLPILALRPYLVGVPYEAERARIFIGNVQARLFRFDRLITLKKFMAEIKLLKQ